MRLLAVCQIAFEHMPRIAQSPRPRKVPTYYSSYWCRCRRMDADASQWYRQSRLPRSRSMRMRDVGHEHLRARRTPRIRAWEISLCLIPARLDRRPPRVTVQPSLRTTPKRLLVWEAGRSLKRFYPIEDTRPLVGRGQQSSATYFAAWSGATASDGTWRSMLLCLSMARMMFSPSISEGSGNGGLGLLCADKTGKGHSGWRAGSY